MVGVLDRLGRQGGGAGGRGGHRAVQNGNSNDDDDDDDDDDDGDGDCYDYHLYCPELLPFEEPFEELQAPV